MATIKDIARKAGVSLTTASFVLSGKAEKYRINADTTARVLEVAARAGYQPNYHARTFRRGRSDTIGVAAPAASLRYCRSGYWQDLLFGVNRYANPHGFDLLLVGGAYPQQATERAIGFYRQKRVDALVVPRQAVEVLKPTRGAESVPAVVLDYPEKTSWPRVVLDEERGLREVVAHLKQLGHVRVAWVTGGDSPRSYAPRTALFAKVAAEAGLSHRTVCLDTEVHEIEKVPFEIYTRKCRAAFAAALAGCRGVSAFLCHDDHIALAVQAALRDAAIRVPEDVSLIGFDDVYARIAVPQITTVSHCLIEMGEEACKLAIQMVKDPDAVEKLWGHVTRVPARLIVNETTGQAPGASSAARKRSRRRPS